ncbi:2-amino-4-hydroxy-6-hydroxymethyldihydropteridine diphosphokinase [Poseidonocella pacifica]|nr:2-amino-4-hydroxy-6-hydroxymethyldihydropteridine diphosphokinase [Poseidonocella pacifica]
MAFSTGAFFIIALGSNLTSSVGDSQQIIAAAVQKLSDSPLLLVSVSRFYATPAFPAGSGPDYVNAAAIVRSKRGPQEVLDLLHEIEAGFARERGARWASRTLDLDLIAVGDIILPDADTQTAWRELSLEEQMTRAPSQLVLPHPRLQDRPFVLLPLLDVAPDWRHPLTGRSIAEMCEALDPTARAEVRALL